MNRRGCLSALVPRALTVASLVICAVSLPRESAAQMPNFDHVFVIIMENEEATNIVGSPSAPYINSLAARYGTGTNYTGVTHPSLPNYMALTSGETIFTDDCVTCRTSAPSLADRIETSGRTWQAYMESMPGTCGTADSGLYAVKHNPFVHFTSIASNPSRCGRIVPFSQFGADLSANRLANFVWITPNLCNDMHDCSVATGDAWLANVVPQILQSPSFARSVLFLVWDEGVTIVGGGGHIPFVVASPWTPAGTTVPTAMNHYGLLRTIEDAWSLAPLGQSAAASAFTAFFPPASSAPTDQVIHARDVTTMAGTWTRVSDASAADGLKLTTPDLGVAAPPAPLASPTSYFEASFNATAGVRYRIWWRMHPRNDSKWNDSVYVQLSDSVDAAGRPIYRIGSTNGYTANLWTCATCQTTGWGWQRNAYWLSDTGDVRFASTGRHTVRVQAREDGVEIDQIVISPTTYANSAPGSASGDTTIVPATTAPPPPGPSPPPPPSNPEVVIYASDLPATATHGAWSIASDSQSPNGVKARTADAGWVATDAPLANPTSYVDVTFTAAADVPYRVWLRLKAEANSKSNDSVWVQFSDASANGSSIYPLNSTAGLLVNLAADGTATGVNGWGWQNGAYWLSQSTLVTFRNAGTHTMRIQVREDGVSFDQVVVSSSRYLSSAPGSLTNDATIVPKP